MTSALTCQSRVFVGSSGLRDAGSFKLPKVSVGNQTKSSKHSGPQGYLSIPYIYIYSLLSFYFQEQYITTPT